MDRSGDFVFWGGRYFHGVFGPVEVFVDKVRPGALSEWKTLWSVTTISDETSGAGPADVTMDSDGYVYMTGAFHGTVDFDPGAKVEEHVAPTEYYWEANVYVSKWSPKGDYLWTRSFDAPQGQNYGAAIALDPRGDLVIVGSWCAYQMDFYPGKGQDLRNCLGFSDIFVSKFTPDGTYVWTKTMGGTAFDTGRDVAVDAAGNIFVTGTFRGIADFDPGPLYDRHRAIGPVADNVFVTKLAPDGSYRWTRTYPSSDPGIAATNDGGVVIASGYSMPLDFDPSESGVHLRTPALQTNGEYSGDIFVIKLNSDGSLGWLYTAGGPRHEEAASAVAAPSGDILVGGRYRGTMDFDPGPGVDERTCDGPASCEFLILFRPDGGLAWVRTQQNVTIPLSPRMLFDVHGNLYYSRRIAYTADADPTCEEDLIEVDNAMDPNGIHVITKLTCSDVNPDYDADGDVDLYDFARFQTCLTGPASADGSSVPPCDTGCAGFDGTGDNVIDAFDLESVASRLTGPR
jgi:hypothetical protein